MIERNKHIEELRIGGMRPAESMLALPTHIQSAILSSPRTPGAALSFMLAFVSLSFSFPSTNHPNYPILYHSHFYIKVRGLIGPVSA
jgi:hypothetical protein